MEFKEKLIKVTTETLQKRFREPQRTIVKDFGNRLNFACPFCLDSDTNINAKRGNLYLDYNIFKCFNDGCPSAFLPMVKYLKDTDNLSFFEFSEIDELKQKTFTKKDYRNVGNKNLAKLLIPREIFKAKYNLVEADGKNFLTDYLRKRNCLKFKKKFLLDLHKRRIFILNCNSVGDIIGYQIRNFSKHLPKYTTHRYSEIIKDFPEYKKEITNQDLLDEIDKKSTIFSIFDIDLDDELVVFEGPIDGFFHPKSVSFSGISRIIANENYKYFFDNDETGYKKAKDFILKGYSVFLWNSFLENYPQFNGVRRLQDILKLDKDFFEKNSQFKDCKSLSEIKTVDPMFLENFPQFKIVKDLNDIINIQPDFDVAVLNNYFSTSEMDLFFL